MKKQILAASFLILVAGVHFAQTAPPNCQTGSPNCYSDMVAYNGHGLASSLPSSLCSNCSNDNRRVIVVRIDTSWGTPTNTNVWNAVNCAINAWNTATDSSGNKTGYYFVLDQGNATNVTNPDITIKQDTSQTGLAENDANVNPGSGTRRNNIELSSANGNLGGGSFTANDLCGRVKHEMAHLIGLGNNSLCNTIMRGSQEGGTRLVNNIHANDVARVNAHFADNDNCGNFTTSSDTPGEQSESTGGGGGGGGGSCPNPNCNEGSGFASDTCAYGSSGCPNGYYDAGGCCQPISITPVLIDVDGSGFRMCEASNGVLFDFYGNNSKLQLSWTAAGSTNAWLVLDRNNNGSIDSGRELFGNVTPQSSQRSLDANGFLALSEYDKVENGGNGDGVIDRSDTVFRTLQLWQDLNHNGVSEPGELHGLPHFNIAELEFRYRVSKKFDDYGNQFRYRAKVNNSKGNQLGRWAWDVFLVRVP